MKMSLDAAADVSSGSSLSFAGFVSEQDKHSMPQKKHVRKPGREERASQEFEFSSVIPKRRYSADNSNGQLLHQRGTQRCSGPGNYGRSASTESSLDGATGKQNIRLENGTEKKRNTSPGFGQKIINSFACKDCRTIETTHSVAG